MDTTETYRKMSEKSPLRKLWKPSIGDFYCDKRENYLSVGVIDESFGQDEVVAPSVFPLFRQDQLQEMIGGFEVSLNLLEKYKLYYLDEATETRMDFWFAHNLTSMEQLWLAFVMKEKYSKVWDGEDWITKK